MNSENSHRFSFQLGLLILFWGASFFTLIVQQTHLPFASENPVIRTFPLNPWTNHPWEYIPWNTRETLVEALVVWLGLLYGLFRLINIVRIIRDDEKENLWIEFWELCE